MLRSLPSPLPQDASLLVIDLQRAIDHPSWGVRNNLDAERNVATLLQAWRTSKRPIYHIRHDSTEAASHYRPGQPGHEFKSEAQPLCGEVVLAQRTNSAFIGTDLESRLRTAHQTVLVVAGVITNNSVEATVRMAANLAFDTFLVEDGCFTFAQKDLEWAASDSLRSSRHESCQPRRRVLHRNANVRSSRSLLYFLMTHSQDTYGQLVVYARMKARLDRLAKIPR
jgi:nicotinamidase-related amidase